MRIANAYENCKAHINVPHENMKRESKQVTNRQILTDTRKRLTNTVERGAPVTTPNVLLYCSYVDISRSNAHESMFHGLTSAVILTSNIKCVCPTICTSSHASPRVAAKRNHRRRIKFFRQHYYQTKIIQQVVER